MMAQSTLVQAGGARCGNNWKTIPNSIQIQKFFQLKKLLSAYLHRYNGMNFYALTIATKASPQLCKVTYLYLHV